MPKKQDAEVSLKFFRQLGPDEVPAFQKWARDNYKPGSAIEPLWHPAVRAECERMNEEAVSQTAKPQSLRAFRESPEGKRLEKLVDQMLTDVGSGKPPRVRLILESKPDKREPQSLIARSLLDILEAVRADVNEASVRGAGRLTTQTYQRVCAALRQNGR